MDRHRAIATKVISLLLASNVDTAALAVYPSSIVLLFDYTIARSIPVPLVVVSCKMMLLTVRLISWLMIVYLSVVQ